MRVILLFAAIASSCYGQLVSYPASGGASSIDYTNVIASYRDDIAYYFPVDSNAGSTNDYSTNRLVSAIAPGIWTNTESGRPSGIGGFVTTSGANAAQLTVTNGLLGTAFSFSVWARFGQIGGSGGVLLERRTNTTPAIKWWVSQPDFPTNCEPTLQISNGPVIEPQTNMGDNLWHHHAITYGTNVWRLYVDGVMLGVTTSAYVDALSTNFIGGGGSESSIGYAKDEVTGWRRTLASNEIVSLYNGGTGLTIWAATVTTTNAGSGGGNIMVGRGLVGAGQR